MTNDTRPPVAPKEWHYAMLRNGEVVGPIKLYDQSRYHPYSFTAHLPHMNWTAKGVSSWDDPQYDIIATISPSQMQWAASPPQITGREIMMLQDAAKAGVKASGIMERLARLEALIPLADAVLDHADQHCRAFPIATAPKSSVALFHGFGWVKEDYTDENGVPWHYKDATHWSPVPKLELPDVFTQLGQALEKIKGAG